VQGIAIGLLLILSILLPNLVRNLSKSGLVPDRQSVWRIFAVLFIFILFFAFFFWSRIPVIAGS